MNKYRIFCETDGKFEHVISDTEISQCPVNQSHTINPESIAVIDDNPVIDGSCTVITTLENYKNIRNEEIDKKTREIIAQPFVYDSNLFSTSEAAQRNWIAIYVFKDLLSYPIYVSTDNDGEYAITDQASLTNMVLSGLGWVQGAYADGRALKVQVNAATTEAEVDAITDNR